MKFCDLGCVHADWPKQEAMDGSGSCRTFVGLYCALKKQVVHKNLPCADRVERRAPDKGQGPGPGSGE